jgi:hypothetical protein
MPAKTEDAAPMDRHARAWFRLLQTIQGRDV